MRKVRKAKEGQHDHSKARKHEKPLGKLSVNANERMTWGHSLAVGVMANRISVYEICMTS